MSWRITLAGVILIASAVLPAASSSPLNGRNTVMEADSAGLAEPVDIPASSDRPTSESAGDPVGSLDDPSPPTPSVPPPQSVPTPPPAEPVLTAADTIVLGYYPVDYPGDRNSYRTLRDHLVQIDMVVYFGLYLDERGDLHNHSGGDAQDIFDLTAGSGKKVLAAVHNARNGGFDGAAAHALLNDENARRRAVENIHELVRQGYAGVNLDLEQLAPADRESYTLFVNEVADRLKPEGYLVTLAVPAKTRDSRYNTWSGAFDYPALGRVADYLVIMSYDEHWPGGSPGPIASAGWVEQVARYAAGTLPPDKVLLGIAAYGYDWSEQGSTRGLTVPGAVRRATLRRATIAWNDTARVPYYLYRDDNGGHTVYFENAASTAVKAALAARHGFAGIAIWRLGFEDPAIWDGVIPHPAQ